MAACPICAKPSQPAYRPFCSKRCADIDLAHWLRGDYVVSDSAAPDDDLVPERPVDEE